MAEALRLVPDDLRNYRCACGHTFDETVEVGYLDISFEGDEDDFDIDDYRTTFEGCCPECGTCCRIDNGEVDEVDKDEESKWLCPSCLSTYDEEEDAVDCCVEEG